MDIRKAVFAIVPLLFVVLVSGCTTSQIIGQNTPPQTQPNLYGNCVAWNAKFLGICVNTRVNCYVSNAAGQEVAANTVINVIFNTGETVTYNIGNMNPGQELTTDKKTTSCASSFHASFSCSATRGCSYSQDGNVQ